MHDFFKDEKKRGAKSIFKSSKDQISHEKEPKIKFLSKKRHGYSLVDVPSDLGEGGLKSGQEEMTKDGIDFQSQENEIKSPTFVAFHERQENAANPAFNSVPLVGPGSVHQPEPSPTPTAVPSEQRQSHLPPKRFPANAPKVEVAPRSCDRPLDNKELGNEDTSPSHPTTSPAESPSTPSSEENGSDSEDVPENSMPSEHKTPVLIHRDPKQDAIIGEFAQRLANFGLLSNDLTTDGTAPSNEASPSLLTKKLSVDQAENRGPSEDSSKPAEAPCAFGANLKTPTPNICSEKTASEPSSQRTSRHELPNRRILWLMIENILETQQNVSLGFKNNDIVRWLDFDARQIENEPASLPVGRYLECETWSGKPVVVPSQYARLISCPLELAQILQRRPRAEVIDDFAGTNDEELSVVTGEVVYLLSECNNTHFMAMNKSIIRGKVPKSVLSVLVPP